MVCLRPGSRGRFFYRIRIHRGRKGERRSMSEADYASLVTAAHNQLKAPVILVWDNLNTHLSTVMRTFTGAHPDWLTVVQLPAYAPDLNPVEGAWSNMKNSLGNLGGCSTPDQLAAIVKNRLKRIQYRPALINGFLCPDRTQPRTRTTVNPDPGLSVSVAAVLLTAGPAWAGPARRIPPSSCRIPNGPGSSRGPAGASSLQHLRGLLLAATAHLHLAVSTAGLGQLIRPVHLPEHRIHQHRDHRLVVRDRQAGRADGVRHRHLPGRQVLHAEQLRRAQQCRGQRVARPNGQGYRLHRRRHRGNLAAGLSAVLQL